MNKPERHSADPRLEPFDESNRRLAELVGGAADRSSPRQDGYDLVVIGGGTAGLVSSAIAAELGADVLLVERSLLGGDCLIAGCVPSKALIRCARAATAARELHRFGVNARGDVRVDFPTIMRRLRKKRTEIAHEDSAQAFEARGVEVVFGEARFVDRRTLRVNARQVRFRRAILATGSRPRQPNIPGLEPGDYLTNETIFGLTELPAKLAVVGAGPLGCEMAQAFARLGGEVVIIEKGDRLMGPEDEDAAALVADALRADGVRIITSAELQRIEREGRHRMLQVATPAGEERIDVSHVLFGIGREAVTDGLALERAGVACSHHGVKTNNRLQTTNPRVYAAGDCCLRAKFTHTADASARIAVRNALFFGREKSSRMIIARCTYTSPEVASVGDTRSGAGVSTLRVPLADVDRAVLDGAKQGWLKLFHQTGSGRILGAVLVADHAGDMISIITATMKSGGTLKDLSDTIFPYPTTAEIVRKAGDAHQLDGLSPFMRQMARLAIRLVRITS